MVREYGSATDWTLVSQAVKDLLEAIDDPDLNESRFRPVSMSIEPDRNNTDTLVVTARDALGRAYKYAAYVTSREVIMDGS